MVKKNLGFTMVEVVVAICVVGIIGAVGYVWWQGQQPRQQNLALSRSVQLKPATAQTVSMKVYTNSRNHYMITLPNSWYVDEGNIPEWINGQNVDDYYNWVNIYLDASQRGIAPLISISTYSDGTCGDVPSRDSTIEIGKINYLATDPCGVGYILNMKTSDGIEGSVVAKGIGTSNEAEVRNALKTLSGLTITSPLK